MLFIEWAVKHRGQATWKAVDTGAESSQGLGGQAVRGETNPRVEAAALCPGRCGQSCPEFPLGPAQDIVLVRE